MLNQLDTLIGFAVVMAVVSLLITIVTQMVSAALGLRGKYLADALETMIHKIDPTITDKVHNLGKQLSKWILMHPVLSDSILPMNPKWLDEIPGIAWLRNRWRIASAIRPDEFFQVLQDIAGVSPDKALAKQETAQQAAELANKALKEPDTWKKIVDSAVQNRDLAKSAADEAKKTAIDAIEAAAKVDATTDATKKQAAAKDASEKVLAAQEVARIATQAAEIAENAGDAAIDVAKAKEFALQAAMRAAAVKLLIALYVPLAVQTVPAEVPPRLT
jgi:hypothetical protein